MNINMPIISQDKYPQLNMKSFVLDPLSVIGKLSILANKPIGTKVIIKQNIIHFQDPGIFQFAFRYWNSTSKMELHYLYNPIKIACDLFLSTSKEDKPHKLRIIKLFEKAQIGIKNLIETYRNCPIIHVCLNFYFSMIANYIKEENNDNLSQKDNMTSLYTEEVVNNMKRLWTNDRIKIVLDLTEFLDNNTSAENNVKSLENILNDIDKDTQSLLSSV